MTMLRPLRIAAVLAAATLAGALAQGVALADTVTSSNWSGYVAHGARSSFREVESTWRQPTGACSNRAGGYSAAWVGLGGYSTTSAALEQIGTELDCSASGKAYQSAWYEMVPAPSEPLAMSVHGGDLMHASVQVVGHRVTLRLSDLTRHETFAKTASAATLDVSSAEWIVEAPSECDGADRCWTLPLADFGQVRFSGATARTAAARGGVSSRLWSTTKLELAPDARAFAAYRSGADAATATPSSLGHGGSAFAVDFGVQPSSSAQQSFTARAAAAPAAPATLQPGGPRRSS